MWLGLVAAAAVILFYFFEKFINIIQEWRTRRKTSNKSSEREGEESEVRKPPIIVREGHEVGVIIISAVSFKMIMVTRRVIK